MTQPPRGRHAGFGPLPILMAALTLTGAVPALQTVQEAALKAAFVYKFVKFTAWPLDALKPGAPLSLCVVNDAAVAGSLRDLTAGAHVEGHEMVMSQPKANALPTVACHLLYVSRLNDNEWAAILVLAKGQTILTVSDQDKFGERGGVIQLILERGGIAFAVNREAAARARLQLAANLLGSARFVKDGSHDD